MSVTRTIGLLLIAVLAMSSSSAADSPELSVGVVVRTYETPDRLVVKRGLAEALRIYRRGGISIDWLEGPSDPSQVTLYLNVSKLDRIGPDNKQRLGAAPGGPHSPGRIAYVFVKPVEDLAYRSNIDPSLLLGAAIAHELAHLLLPSGSHSEHGIMRAKWGDAEVRASARGDLRLTEREFVAMRAALQAPRIPNGIEVARR